MYKTAEQTCLFSKEHLSSDKERCMLTPCLPATTYKKRRHCARIVRACDAKTFPWCLCGGVCLGEALFTTASVCACTLNVCHLLALLRLGCGSSSFKPAPRHTTRGERAIVLTCVASRVPSCTAWTTKAWPPLLSKNRSKKSRSTSEHTASQAGLSTSTCVSTACILFIGSFLFVCWQGEGANGQQKYQEGVNRGWTEGEYHTYSPGGTRWAL